MSTEDDSTTVIEFLHGGAPDPVLPNNAVESMLAGIPVPALPGIEDLFAPLIELGKSLGTGTFAGIDPVGIFDQASTLIDLAMGLSQSAVAEVGQTWNSTGSEAATELSRSAQNSGAELSERGTAISKTAAAAAESVQRGNANLAAIVQSFATTVAAAAPIAWTPPGQAMLLASAAEHMQAAVASVTRTRGEMLGHTAAMNALAGSIPVPTPPTSEALSNLVTPEAINNAARQIAQPLSPQPMPVTRTPPTRTPLSQSPTQSGPRRRRQAPDLRPASTSCGARAIRRRHSQLAGRRHPVRRRAPVEHGWVEAALSVELQGAQRELLRLNRSR